MGKILSLNKLKIEIKKLKKYKKKIVLTNGCFDVLHVGHVRYLRAAKDEGDILVVAINSDKSVRGLKGNSRPIVPQDERAKILCAMEMVDYVVIFGEPTVENVIKNIKPDIHAKGTDYTKNNVPERHLLGKYIGEIKIVGDNKTHSTKDVIKVVKEKFEI